MATTFCLTAYIVGRLRVILKDVDKLPFTRLLRRDLMPSRRMSVLLIVATLIWYVILYFRATRADPLVTTAWAWLPLAIIPVIAVVSGISLIQRQMESILNPSDPHHVAGWQCTLSNLIVIVLRVIAYCALVIVLGVWIVDRSVAVPNILELLPIPAMNWFIGLLVLALAGLIGISVIGALIGKTGYIFSRFSSRSHVALTIWLTIMILWAGLRFIPALSGWLFWLPHASIKDVAAVGNVFTFFTTYFESGPYVATLLYGLVLFLASSYAIDVLKKGHSGPYALESGKLRKLPTISNQNDDEDVDDQDDADEIEEKSADKKKKTSRYSRRPAQMPDLREKILIIMFALSALFIYDFFDHRLPTAAQVASIFIQPVHSNSAPQGFHINAPFAGREGTLQIHSDNAATLQINGIGDINIIAGETEHVTVRYALRVYGDSALQSRGLLNHTDVLLRQDGDTIFLRPTFPHPEDERFIRVNYDVEVPPQLALRLQTTDSIIHLHETGNDAVLQLENASLYASRFQGDITVVGKDVLTTFVDGHGTLDVQLDDGVIEMHGHTGDIRMAGHETGVHIGDVRGNIEARLSRGVSFLQEITGDISVESNQTRVETWEVWGHIHIEGNMSPIRLVGAPESLYVRSDRGNVNLSLAPNTEWEAHIEVEKGEIIDHMEDRFPNAEDHDDRGSNEPKRDKPPVLGEVGALLDVKTTGADVILR